MISREAILPLVLFVALMLSTALTGLAASGHFPREHRAAPLRGNLGSVILVGVCALTALALIIGTAAAWHRLPVPLLVIGGGAAMLAAPLLLRPLPDHLVNGRAVLLLLSGASLFCALALTWL